jgi:hemoglobin/transferrin/lactoferrin receptor protein
MAWGQTPGGNLSARQLTADDLQLAPAASQQVVVSASRSAKALGQVPLTVHIVTGEDIRRNGYTSLVDVLKHVPGFRASQPGSGTLGEMFLMRGLLGNRYTKILINSIPIQPTVLEGMPLGEQLPVRQAERIEIIYGTASAMYGADAMAGVINIILPQENKESSAQADLSGGTYGYFNLNFNAGGKLGKNRNIFQYQLYGGQSRRNDQPIRPEDPALFAPVTYLGPVANNPALFSQAFPFYQGTPQRAALAEMPHESRLIGAQLGWRGWRASYNYMYRRDHSSLGQLPAIYAYNRPNNFLGEQVQRLTLSHERGGERFSSLTNLSYVNYRRDNASNFGVNYPVGAGLSNVYLYTASNDLFAEQLFTYRPHPNWEFIAGGSAQYSGNLPNTNYLASPFVTSDYQAFSTSALPRDPVFGGFGLNPVDFYNVATFVQGYYTSGKWAVLGGVRTDYNSRYGQVFLPRLAVQFNLTDQTSVRASAGTSFLAPPTNWAYASLASTSRDFRTGRTGFVYLYVPNPDLGPERLQSAEVGLRQQFGPKLMLDVNVYLHAITGVITVTPTLIDPAQYPSPLPLGQGANPLASRQYQNSANQRSNLLGGQLALHGKNLLSKYRLGFDAQVSLARGFSILQNGERVDNYRQMPSFIGQWRVYANPLPKLYVALEAQTLTRSVRGFVPTRQAFEQGAYSFIAGYTNVDALLRYDFDKRLGAFVRGVNVFDQQFGGLDATSSDSDLIYNPQRGRIIYLGLSAKL